MKISPKLATKIRSVFSRMYGKGFSFDDMAEECGLSRGSFTEKAEALGLYKKSDKPSNFNAAQIERMKELYKSDYKNLKFTGMAKQLAKEFGRKVSDCAVRAHMIKCNLHHVKPSDTGVPVKQINIANFCQDWLKRKWVS